MSKKKIFNDPVYGFISYPYEILYDIINHPYYQRLRRIGQMGLSHYVYPGALHTRFHHGLGSLHLITQAISVLREKGVEISEEEAKAVSIAILLHDIGHGPISHALEGLLIKVSHEEISLAFMEELNQEFEGKLDLAIKIFKNQYSRFFLHQLISSQLDMDRMDYLNRDSFFTGVSEGVVSYDRIIKMLNVVDNELVVEEKGLYSIEKFLMSRRLMYWQVYLHKTSIATEQMLIRFIKSFKKSLANTEHHFNSEALKYFFAEGSQIDKKYLSENQSEVINKYALVDDNDIFALLKSFLNSKEYVLNYLANGLIHRKLFKIDLREQDFDESELIEVKEHIAASLDISPATAGQLIIHGSESNISYSPAKNEINILYKTGEVKPLSTGQNYLVDTMHITKYFLCYPKL